LMLLLLLLYAPIFSFRINRKFSSKCVRFIVGGLLVKYESFPYKELDEIVY